ncbi:hypothetical protein [Sporosarcina sp. P37]|nr:hypothetical protein [Sporosarcina sp. P37]
MSRTGKLGGRQYVLTLRAALWRGVHMNGLRSSAEMAGFTRIKMRRR